ncbi:MAG: hypothetical protein ACI4WT_08040 [Oligosphaeraceae bacterium]
MSMECDEGQSRLGEETAAHEAAAALSAVPSSSSSSWPLACLVFLLGHLGGLLLLAPHLWVPSPLLSAVTLRLHLWGAVLLLFCVGARLVPSVAALSGQYRLVSLLSFGLYPFLEWGLESTHWYVGLNVLLCLYVSVESVRLSFRMLSQWALQCGHGGQALVCRVAYGVMLLSVSGLFLAHLLGVMTLEGLSRLPRVLDVLSLMQPEAKALLRWSLAGCLAVGAVMSALGLRGCPSASRSASRSD